VVVSWGEVENAAVNCATLVHAVMSVQLIDIHSVILKAGQEMSKLVLNPFYEKALVGRDLRE
jgi:hypothetical protein